jgi:hypothetical protein
MREQVNVDAGAEGADDVKATAATEAAEVVEVQATLEGGDEGAEVVLEVGAEAAGGGLRLAEG